VSIPTYFANRLWVWQSSGPIAPQALAYWLTTVINVAVATAIVWLATALHADRQLLMAIPLATYTVLWLARYFVLDRLVFNRRL
jgi:hypothetical protein